MNQTTRLRYLTPEDMKAAGLYPGFKNLLPLPKNPRDLTDEEMRAHFPGIDGFLREVAALSARKAIEKQASYDNGN